MKSQSFLIFSVAVVLTSILTVLFYFGYLRFNYPSYQTYPIRGIDISHHQGEIDWEKLAEEKLDFVFMKATEGATYVDPKFSQNWQAAQEKGYAVGAYHFYRLCKTGKEQAENIIKVVPKDSDLPPVLDLEYYGNCHTELSKSEIVKEIKNCIQILEDHYGEAPILYVMADFYRAYVMNDFKSNPIWFRNIWSKPRLRDQREWTFWQYSNRGRLAGIDGYVDLNVFKASEEEFYRFMEP
ncbi:MAG: glycoside hydrolase family 25 protein [Bacteroidia bacterium]|nr:glycoside hydrolase family 25 protein [Bacteroidia bacterium]